MMFIKAHAGKSIHGSISNRANMKNYRNATEQQFETSAKALASTLMSKLSSINFKDTKVIHEHIMEMTDIVAQLKSLEIDISEFLLVHFILNSLPSEYGPFRISYNTY